MSAETDLLPLRVFSAGTWVFTGSDQEFTGEELDESAFAAYRANLAELQREVEGLRAEVAEARGLVTEANNSLYGSQSYFHSLDGGPYNKHHLSNGIEDLKGRARAGHAAEARAERLAGALREIADWKLPETGETWPSGGAVSYEAAVGSRGVQDYIRAKARAALDQETTNG